MTKYKHHMNTMDGVIESESDVPQPPIKTPEMLEAERVRRYPSTEFASYLLYVCSYCLDKFYLVED